MSRYGRIVCLTGPHAGEEYELNKETISIGRSSETDVMLEDQFASRLHTEIRQVDNAYQVHDLNSKNGVHINGQRLEPGATAWLTDGIELQLASTHFRFHDPSATVTAPSLIAVNEPALRVDPITRQVHVDGTLVDPPLSVKQFDLLWFLFQNRGRVVSKDEIAQVVWRKPTVTYTMQILTVWSVGCAAESTPDRTNRALLPRFAAMDICSTPNKLRLQNPTLFLYASQTVTGQSSDCACAGSRPLPAASDSILPSSAPRTREDPLYSEPAQAYCHTLHGPTEPLAMRKAQSSPANGQTWPSDRYPVGEQSDLRHRIIIFFNRSWLQWFADTPAASHRGAVRRADRGDIYRIFVEEPTVITCIGVGSFPTRISRLSTAPHRKGR